MRLHASALEWIFWAISLGILLAGIWATRQAQLDFDALIEQRVNGDKRLKAVSDIHSGYFTIVNGMIMSLVSSLSLVQPPPDEGRDYSAQMLSLLIGWVLLGVSTTLMLWNQRITRGKIMRSTPQVHVLPTYVTESVDDAAKHPGDPVVLMGRRSTDRKEDDHGQKP